MMNVKITTLTIHAAIAEMHGNPIRCLVQCLPSFHLYTIVFHFYDHKEGLGSIGTPHLGLDTIKIPRLSHPYSINIWGNHSGFSVYHHCYY